VCLAHSTEINQLKATEQKLNMKSFLPKTIVSLIALIVAHSSASANIVISLSPASQSIGVGDSASMDIVISGLNAFAAPGVGAFDFDLTYNPSVLSALSVSFGNHLDLGIFGSFQSFDLSSPGAIHLDEVSLESTSDLLQNQPASFKLATLNFSGAGPGSSSVTFASAILSDATGETSITPNLVGADVLVSGGSASVPDTASTASLLPLCLLGMWVLRRSARA
jgi:hypothetical protein